MHVVVTMLRIGRGSFSSRLEIPDWTFLRGYAKTPNLCHKIATFSPAPRRPTAGCLQEIDQFLEVDPIADIQEAVGPVEVYMLPANTPKSVGKIAEILGFDLGFHLSKQFKNSSGLAPQAWRKRLLTNRYQ
jgi:hypothetical protein